MRNSTISSSVLRLTAQPKFAGLRTRFCGIQTGVPKVVAVWSTTLKRQLWVLQEGGALPPHETRNTELAEALAELNRVVITEMTLDDLLAQVLLLARARVSGTDGASVSLTRDGTYFTSNATDDVVRELDAVQYENDDGPCVEAMRTAQQVSISLLRESDRFAPFSAAALGRFMSAVLSTPFLVQGQPIGALNLYSASVSAFGSGEAEVASCSQSKHRRSWRTPLRSPSPASQT
jgi:hypothetical protein